jgi:uncharacterized protein YjiS (DUF1127 family)
MNQMPKITWIERAGKALLERASQRRRTAESAKSDVVLTPRQIRRAEKELMAYSDPELAELGISRGDIPYVVRHGRQGIDDLAA